MELPTTGVVFREVFCAIAIGACLNVGDFFPPDSIKSQGRHADVTSGRFNADAHDKECLYLQSVFPATFQLQSATFRGTRHILHLFPTSGWTILRSYLCVSNCPYSTPVSTLYLASQSVCGYVAVRQTAKRWCGATTTPSYSDQEKHQPKVTSGTALTAERAE